MPSPFAKYQSEQVQQIAPGFVEGFGRAGASIGQGIAALGAGVAQGLEARREEEKKDAVLRGTLSAYIRNDERVKRAEDLTKAGIFTKAADGTLTIDAKWADKVNMDEAQRVLSFYNTTGGDGSKLAGNALNEFTARFEGERKYIADQSAREAAKVELDLKKAQIDELRSKAAERTANAGMYGAAIAGMGFGVAGAAPTELPSVVLPDINPTYNATPDATQPLTKADTTLPAVAAPATAAETTAPVVSEALTAGTKGTPATATQAPTSADFDQYGYPKAKPAAAPAAQPVPAAPAAPAAKPQAAPAPAAPAAPAAQAAPTAAPAAPQTFDVAAKASEVSQKMKVLDERRTAVRTKYAGQRKITEAQLAVSQRNASLPRTKSGLEAASTVLSYNQTRLKLLGEAEDRDIKAIDSEADTIKTEFTAYQQAATAARAERSAAADVRKEAAATAKAKTDRTIELVQGYPIIGTFAAIGANLRDPKTGELADPALVASIPRIETAQKGEILATHTGYMSAQGFLLKMDDILRDRNASGNEIRDRFRLTAGDMKGYFEGELASVFGVATFRKAIVSGGNFSDADREFVKSAITYLNSAAPDMSAADLKASLDALTGFINAMYMRSMEANGMRYAPDQAAAQAEKLRAYGANADAEQIESNVKLSQTFYNRFNIKTTAKSSYSPEFRQAVNDARATLWSTLKKGGVKTKDFEGSDPKNFK